MEWKNVLTDLFKTDFPIVQAPMLGVTTPEMAVAASNAGALGSLALGDLPAEKCIELIRATRKLTNKPFAVNIFVHKIDPITPNLKADYAKTKKHLQKLTEKLGIQTDFPDINEIKLTDYHDQIEAILLENCKIVSFTFGNLDQESIATFKENKVLLIGTCTSVQEAIALENSGIDIICVQGIEAGGHRGSFLEETIPQIGGLSLLSQVTEAVNTPVIYAGGIYNAKTLLASKTLGADGFQIGSLFLGSTESALQDFEKHRLRNIKENEIVLTKSFTGRYARGIKNTFIKEIENSEFILPYPYQNKLTTELRKTAKLEQNADFVSIWMGQSITSYSDVSTEIIIRNLLEETENFV
ncbi:NAD(P)H-dependent flavin oxidoreductase [Flavobacterium tistrianum]|uniref:NAD(P)H-dependent flavin oxidoreductase n=1 Tax=Flavobacterium tistrianum TaxID=1685414 RepID=UPI000DABA271|nr:nitronate monooxygenase family protein [Flavobacterium tistrianum]KAF2338476.1 nitronate monooxygenase [Flavobacterium tistrianum]